MKFGIYYSYWEQEWTADCFRHIEKISKLGFDIMEVAAYHLNACSLNKISAIKQCAEENDILLTAGLGPRQEHNIASSEPIIRLAAEDFFKMTFDNLARLNIRTIGGALHSYWPIDYSQPVNKKRDWELGVQGVQKISQHARDCGITLCLEALNRFENHVINTAAEAVSFVKEVERENVKVMLDTFHMNIEEDSLGGAIREAGSLLGHFHIGEANRKVPGRGRIPWSEISDALADIEYQGAIVMEPFVRMGGSVGSDIRVWRDLSDGADEMKLDQDAQKALLFCRHVFEQ